MTAYESQLPTLGQQVPLQQVSSAVQRVEQLPELGYQHVKSGRHVIERALTATGTGTYQAVLGSFRERKRVPCAIVGGDEAHVHAESGKVHAEIGEVDAGSMFIQG